MANILIVDTLVALPPKVKKLRRKQAKREAELMVNVERAKKQIERAERKVTKAQSRLETSKKSLQQREDRLSRLRIAGQQKLDEVLARYVGEPIQPHPQSSEEQPALGVHESPETSEQNGTGPEAVPVNQVTDLPPAEGHTDIPQVSTSDDAGSDASQSADSQADAPQLPVDQTSTTSADEQLTDNDEHEESGENAENAEPDDAGDTEGDVPQKSTWRTTRRRKAEVEQ